MASLLARTVHFVVGGATLLSGGLTDCLTPFDASCNAGISNLDALMRNWTKDEPSLLLPFFDRNSPFVQMHPLNLAVNRLIYQGMLGLEVFSAPPSLLQQHKLDGISSRDLSFLQTPEFPFLLSNVAVAPGNSWSAYQIPIYWDEETGLAVISIINDRELYNVDQIESAIGLLNDVERYNRRSGCYGNNDDSSSSSGQSPYDSYFNKTSYTIEKKCWIPVVVYADVRTSFESWFQAVVNHDFPPALVVNIEERMEQYAEPTFLIDDGGVWVVSYELRSSQYDQLTLQIAEGGRSIETVEYLSLDMETISDELKDSSYVRLQNFLHQLATEAEFNDPVVGQSVQVPVQRSGTYRRCKSGMCETGNLYTDAIRWYTKADIAFQGSGGFRGSGWEAGDVHVSDVWGANPFDNDLCTGVMSGANMFHLFNYSLYHSTFEGENTRDGGLLLQVSGIRLSFNLQLPNTARIVKMEIWDEETGIYSDVQRHKLYSFATDSFICSGYGSYPMLLGEESLDGPGEVPGFIGDTPIVQSVVADYLAQFQDDDTPYDHSIPGERLVNRTDILEPLDFIQTEDDCLTGEYYWEATNSTCVSCPKNEAPIAILTERLELDSEEEEDDDDLHGSIKLMNVAQSIVDVLIQSLPSYLSIESIINEAGNATNFNKSFQNTIRILPGETITLIVTVDADDLEPGSSRPVITLGVVDVGSYPGCTGRDVTFEISSRDFPPEELNQLGKLRYVGFALAAIACTLALAATVWVFMFREKSVVRVMQPIFLCAISIGVFIMALAMIATSIDDEIVSQESADIACMAVPWFLSIGFTMSMSALFSKLWRIHRIFSGTRRGKRMKLKAKDVILPFAVMFLFNSGVVLAWNLWSPRVYKRVPMEDQPWNSYGNCQSEDETLDYALLTIAFVVNVGPLAAASYMAYQVRNVSDEFSEAKRVGLALFIWVQFVLVGGPMYFLIKQDNPSARYFLETGSIFLVSVSMLALIFVPIIRSKQQHSEMFTNRDAINIAEDASFGASLSASFKDELGGASSSGRYHHHHHDRGSGSSGGRHDRGSGLNDRNRLEDYSLLEKGPRITGVNWTTTPLPLPPSSPKATTISSSSNIRKLEADDNRPSDATTTIMDPLEEVGEREE